MKKFDNCGRLVDGVTVTRAERKALARIDEAREFVKRYNAQIAETAETILFNYEGVKKFSPKVRKVRKLRAEGAKGYERQFASEGLVARYCATISRKLDYLQEELNFTKKYGF